MIRLIIGDCRVKLRELPDESVHCVVTSPPYFGLRDYGTAKWEGGDAACDHKQGRNGSGRADGIVDDRAQRNRDGVGAMGGYCRKCGAVRIDAQLGLEPTIDAYVANMVDVFREVRRVLRKDGTLWLNLGDSYAGCGPIGLKSKDLCGIPWRVAFALQADGWYLRQDIIWSKSNPMPESVTDRCTKAHEYIFLLSKSVRYYYDAEAIAESVTASTLARVSQPTLAQQKGSWRVPGKTNGPMRAIDHGPTRNKRSVWEIATQPFSEAHFATMPPALIEPCVKAGCSLGGTVLDPFAGAGTVGLVADRLQRNAILIELNPKYAAMSEDRIHDDAPLFVHLAK